MQIVVQQISGLGNQLFQYAAGRYFSARYEATFSVAVDPNLNASSYGYPRPFLLSHFAVQSRMAPLSRVQRSLFSERRVVKQVASVAKQLLGIQLFAESIQQRYNFLEDIPLERGVRTLYLQGYWQTWKTPAAIESTLRSEFALRTSASGRTLALLSEIISCSDSVSLHVRRGDYTLAAEGNIALPLGYYNKAISYMQNNLRNPVFFVFSDDMAYARACFPKTLNCVFVDHNDDSTAFEDIRLMSSCRHHIIANSSFSWWGAWLNPRKNKIVVAPRFWHLDANSYYPDLLPPEWVLIAF